MIDLEEIRKAIGALRSSRLVNSGGFSQEAADRLCSAPPTIDGDDALVPLLLAIVSQLNRLEMKIDGRCPTCGADLRHSRLTPADRSYPEWANARHAEGLDPVTGHRVGCTEPR